MPTRRRSRALPQDPRQRLIATAFTLAAETGWRRLGMAEIAATAGVPLAEAYPLFRSRFALLAGFRRSIDEAVLAGPAPSANDPVRDRLFEVLMRRFEALKPYRAGLKVILRDSIGTPAAIKGLLGLRRSMAWMLAAAGVPAGGIRGQLMVKLVGALYLSMFPAFLRDDSADLGITMAALDRRLRQAENLLATFSRFGTVGRKPQT